MLVNHPSLKINKSSRVYSTSPVEEISWTLIIVITYFSLSARIVSSLAISPVLAVSFAVFFGTAIWTVCQTCSSRCLDASRPTLKRRV